MPLGKKKKKKQEEGGTAEAAEQNGEKAPGLFSRLKNLKISVSFKNGKKKKQTDGGEEERPGPSGSGSSGPGPSGPGPSGGARPGEPEDEEKDSGKGKKKKKKEKKPKKEKAPKAKKPKAEGEAKGKPKALVPVMIAVGGVLVGAGGFLLYNSLMGGPSLAERIMNAQMLLNDLKYEEAEAAYADIAAENPDSATAQLGLADAKLGREDTEGALASLRAALEPTNNNANIQAKIDEILGRNAALATPGALPPPSDTPILFADSAFESMLRQAMGKSISEPISELDLERVTQLKILGATHAAVELTPLPAPEPEQAAEPEEPSNPVELVAASAGNFATAASHGPPRPEVPAVLPAATPGNTATGGDLASVEDLATGGTVPAPVAADAGALPAISDLDSLNQLDGYTIDGVKHMERGGIKTLLDLRNFRNLRKLTVGYNQISDISGLEGLGLLDTLGLYCNDINDIGPLEGLSSLRYAYLYNNAITDISPLGDLSSLEVLRLDYNGVGNLEPLKNAAALEQLFIAGNPVTDFTPVEHVYRVERGE